jgi:hypothetical protein
LSVWADAAPAERPSTKVAPRRNITRFMGQPLWDDLWDDLLGTVFLEF